MSHTHKALMYNCSYVAMDKLNYIIYCNPRVSGLIIPAIKKYRVELNPSSETINKSKRVWESLPL